MADFPGIRYHRPTISSVGLESIGVAIPGSPAGSPASAAWPAANRAIFVPFVLAGPYQVTKVWWANGATASSNVDCGIYTLGGALLGSCGSTAQAGTSIVQSATLSLLLQPGSYYMALATPATTGTFLRNQLGATSGFPADGGAQMASAFPLPATATFAAVASAYLPVFGLTSSSVI